MPPLYVLAHFIIHISVALALLAQLVLARRRALYVLPFLACTVLAADDAIILVSPSSTRYTPRHPLWAHLIALAGLTASLLILVFVWARASRNRLSRTGYTLLPIAFTLLLAFSFLIAISLDAVGLARTKKPGDQAALMLAGLILGAVTCAALGIILVLEWFELEGGGFWTPAAPQIDYPHIKSPEPSPDQRTRQKRLQLLLLFYMALSLATAWVGFRYRYVGLVGNCLFLFPCLVPKLLGGIPEPIPKEGTSTRSLGRSSVSSFSSHPRSLPYTRH